MFFGALLLNALLSFIVLVGVFHHLVAIRIWVKPSNLRYVAEILCYRRTAAVHHINNSNNSNDNSNNSIFPPAGVASASPSAVYGGGDYSVDGGVEQQQQMPMVIRMGVKYADFGELFVSRVNLSGCDKNDPKAYIRITLYDSNESRQFEILKTDLLQRQAPVLFHFGAVSSVHRLFKMYHSALFGLRRNRTTDYELEIFCDFIQSNGKTAHFTIGSAIQRKEQKSVNMSIYEIELLVGCVRDKIDINVHYKDNREAKKVNLKTTRDFLLQNESFKIDLTQLTIQSSVRSSSAAQNAHIAHSRQLRTNRSSSSSTSERLSRTTSSRQSSVGSLRTGPSAAGASSSGLTRVRSLNAWLSRACSLRRCLSKTEKQTEKSAVEQTTGYNNRRCVICADEECQIALIPCGHYCACVNCSNILLGTVNKCAICREPIKDILRIQGSKIAAGNSDDGGIGGNSLASKKQGQKQDEAKECCILCRNNQREIALIPCGHYHACSECAQKKIGEKCSICEQVIKSKLKLFC